MGNGKLTVVARIKAKPGQEARVRKELQELLVPTRAEDGCLNFDMHESLDRPGDFLFYENWTSRAHLDRHIQAPHIQNWFKLADSLLSEPVELSFWRRVA